MVMEFYKGSGYFQEYMKILPLAQFLMVAAGAVGGFLTSLSLRLFRRIGDSVVRDFRWAWCQRLVRPGIGCCRDPVLTGAGGLSIV